MTLICAILLVISIEKWCTHVSGFLLLKIIIWLIIKIERGI